MKKLKFGFKLPTCNRYFCIQISKNRPEYWESGCHGVRSSTSPNFKTHKTLVLEGFLLCTHTYLPKVYMTLLSRDLKNKRTPLTFH